MKCISVLIPTYNTPCVQLVRQLHQQAEELGISYEIIVGDDGSTDATVLTANRAISELAHCRVMERGENAGRAAIRNFLARQAQHEWLLFIDSDMVVCSDSFLKHYVEESDERPVVDGGVVIRGGRAGNLRFMYEKAAEQQHTAARRQRTPYQHLHTANLMIRRDIMLRYPFDELFRRYGYEDVMLGKQLQQGQVPISHIDNPLSFEVFEDNELFVSKAEEGLRTLHQFRNELQGYSALLALQSRLGIIAPLIRLWHHANKKWERRLLTGSHPHLMIFNLYRLGYFLSL